VNPGVIFLQVRKMICMKFFHQDKLLMSSNDISVVGKHNIENTITEKRKNTNKENLEVVKFLFSSKFPSSRTTTLFFFLQIFKPNCEL